VTYQPRVLGLLDASRQLFAEETPPLRAAEVVT